MGMIQSKTLLFDVDALSFCIQNTARAEPVVLGVDEDEDERNEARCLHPFLSITAAAEKHEAFLRA